MRRRSWLRWTAALAVVAVALWVGCTEDEPVTVDQTPPVVAFVNPHIGQGLNISPTSVPDTVTIVVEVQDLSGIERVQFWVTFHSEATSRLLGESATPIAPGTGGGQTGSSLYKYYWDASAMPNGTTGALWAVAYDKLGNAGRTKSPISIRIISREDVSPPVADFTIATTPPGTAPTVAATFLFDPSHTTDAIDPPNRIRVRWDFDYTPGSPSWDIDTTDARATNVQEQQFAQARTYTIALQAFNTYYGGGSEIVTRDLTVLPEFGEPRPPAPVVQIPKGTYPMGVTNVAGGNATRYSENELVRAELNVTISANLFIDKYEVTNGLYAGFLDTAAAAGIIAFNQASGEITLVETGELLLTIDTDLTRIIYIDAEVGFSVDSNARNLPVTGVTWQGAKAYCSFYGLRLPTEYEWEIAARGGQIITTADAGYVYPWVPLSTITGAYANYANSGDPYEERGNRRAEARVGSYSDIDSLLGSWPHENAVGPFGTYDQAGNVAEWVDDWYVPRIYNTMRDRVDVTGRWPVDPQSPRESESLTGTRVVRGGSFFDTPPFLRVTRRAAADPLVGSPTVGFRAVYTEFIP